MTWVALVVLAAWLVAGVDAYLITHRGTNPGPPISADEENRLLYEPMSTPTQSAEHFVLPDPDLEES